MVELVVVGIVVEEVVETTIVGNVVEATVGLVDATVVVAAWPFMILHKSVVHKLYEIPLFVIVPFLPPYESITDPVVHPR